jgi:hypothetical protein
MRTTWKRKAKWLLIFGLIFPEVVVSPFIEERKQPPAAAPKLRKWILRATWATFALFIAWVWVFGLTHPDPGCRAAGSFIECDRHAPHAAR